MKKRPLVVLTAVIIGATLTTLALASCGPMSEDEVAGGQRGTAASRSDALTISKGWEWYGPVLYVDFTQSETCQLLLPGVDVASYLSSLISNPIVAAAVAAALQLHHSWFTDNIGTNGERHVFSLATGIITDVQRRGSPSSCSSSGGGGGGSGGGTCHRCASANLCCGAVDAQGCCDDACRTSTTVCN